MGNKNLGHRVLAYKQYGKNRGQRGDMDAGERCQRNVAKSNQTGMTARKEKCIKGKKYERQKWKL